MDSARHLWEDMYGIMNWGGSTATGLKNQPWWDPNTLSSDLQHGPSWKMDSTRHLCPVSWTEEVGFEHTIFRPAFGSMPWAQEPRHLSIHSDWSRDSSAGSTSNWNNTDVGSSSWCSRGFVNLQGVNLQCRLSHDACTAPCAIACISIYAHVKILTTGSYAIVATHENTASTDRSG